MELAKLLIKLFYLVVIYLICFMILKSQTPLTSTNLYVISLLVSILIMYFTFDLVYNFLVNSEIIFKSNSEGGRSGGGGGRQQSRSRIESDESTNVNKSNQSSQDYNMSHSHQFIQDQVFFLIIIYKNASGWSSII